MRIVGIDFGGARIGVAVGESGVGLVSPRKPLEASGTLKTDARHIVELAAQEEAGTVVVGLPLVEGEETKMSRVCRALGAEIAALGTTVAFCDESWTSHEAETAMFEVGLKGSERRKKSDGEAACRIVERYLEADVPKG
ncbi:MAG: Holliday junction resolvase RuvX [Armatimonadetes bacterium]|nr:Holliday junction resolvase RuvX [Armatimonadota bacterium]